jgi:hypothetical protein
MFGFEFEPGASGWHIETASLARLFLIVEMAVPIIGPLAGGYPSFS